MKSIKFHACPASPKTTPNKLSFLALFPSNSSCSSIKIAKLLSPRKRNSTLFITLCSTKPHTHSDNTINGNSNVEVHSNPNDLQQNQPQPSPKHPLSSNHTPSSRGLVFAIGRSGSWDGIEIGSPVVKRFLSDEEERWYMWYYGRSEKTPDCDTMGLAVSSNGVHWQRGEKAVDSSSGTGMVMNCGDDWWAFDTKSIRPAEIMIMSSNKVRISSAVYWLYYTGFSSEEIELPQDLALKTSLSNPEMARIDARNVRGRVFKSLPGLAISQDGRNWARIEGDHHSGALFDVGSSGEWDSLYIASPHVVFHSSGDLRMYYHSFDSKDKKFGIGMARSRDGIKWLKLGKVMGGGLSEGCFDEMGVVNACVVRDQKDGNYLMAYEGVAKDGKRSIGLAVSTDGLKDWRRTSNEPVFVASSDDGWDSKGVGSPCLVQMDGDEDRWRLYYTGVGEDCRTGIGLAVSQGSDMSSFRRWSGFHL